MKALRKIAIAALAFAGTVSLYAQGNNPLAGKDSLQLTGNYKAELGEMEKPEIKIPETNMGKVDTEGIKYEEKKFDVKATYTPPDARIAPPEKITWPKLHNNMLKLGYGRFGTLLGQLYLNSGRNAKADVGLDFTHLSSSNTSSGFVDYAEFREDFGTLRATSTLDNHTIGAKVHLYNTNYFYFADSLLAESPELQDSVKNNFTKLEITTGIAKNYNPDELYYNVDLRFRGMFDKWKNQDLHVSALPSLSWAVNEQFSAAIDGELTFSNSKFSDTAQSRFFLDFTPTVKFKTGEFEVRGGLKVNSYSDSNSTFRAFPLLNASYRVADDMLKLSAGLKGEMHYYTYYDQIAQNRYLQREANIEPGIEKLNLYAGVDGNIANYLNYSIRGYTKKIENQLIYFNPENGAYFQMLYDTNFRQTGAEIMVEFNKDDKIKAGVKADFRTFKTEGVAYNFGMPKTKVDFWASYNFADKVWASTEVYLLGSRVMSVDSAGEPISESFAADVNLNVDYRFSKRISIFLELNNLLGVQYSRWYNYRNRPFDIRGGVTLSF